MLESIFLTLSTRLAIGNLYKEIVRHIVDEYPRWARWAPFRRQCELSVVERFFEGVSCAFELVWTSAEDRTSSRAGNAVFCGAIWQTFHRRLFLVWRSSSRLSPVAYRCGEDGNLGQENPLIVAETEDFPEEFAVDADMENRASLTSRRRLRWSRTTTRLTNREGRL